MAKAKKVTKTPTQPSRDYILGVVRTLRACARANNVDFFNCIIAASGAETIETFAQALGVPILLVNVILSNPAVEDLREWSAWPHREEFELLLSEDDPALDVIRSYDDRPAQAMAKEG